MKPRMDRLLEMCIENGIDYGIRRAHKHTDDPTEEMIKEEILNAIRIELYEWFEFEDQK
jgi:hypothetical protein